MNGRLLAQGLLNAKGDDLRLVYALLMETKMLDLLTARVKDTFNKDVNHFEQDLQREIAQLQHYSDAELQFRLFLYVLEQLDIKGAHYNISSEIEHACEQIVEQVYVLQAKQDKEFLAFTKNRNEEKAIQLVLYQMRKIFQSFDETIGDLSEQQTENLVVQIEQYIQALPAEKQRQIKEKLNIDELTTKTIRQLVVSQGTVIIMSIIVEVAGFAAFTTLTSFIATTVGFFGITLPFGAYIFATSAFSVITGPIGIAAMLIGGGFLLKHQNDKARRMMIPIGIVQLLLPVVIEGEQRVSADSFIAQWLPIYEEQQALQEKIKTDEQQLNVLIESSVRYRGKMNDAFHSIEQKKRNVQKQYEQLQHSIGLIERYEQSRQYDELKKELDHIQAEIKNQKDEMAQNSRQTGFFNTIKNSFANYQIKGQVVEKDLQYARKQQELLQEIVRMKPAKLQAQCDQINIIEAELSMEKNDLADLSNEKLKIDKNISQKETELQTTKKQLKQHQKQYYGLKHIE